MSETMQAPYGGSSSERFGESSGDTAESGTNVTTRAGSMIDSATEKAGGLVDQAKPAVDAGMEKAASGLQTAAETLRGRGESMGEGQLSSVATMTADKLESGAEMLRGTDTDALVIELENMVRRKPVESLAVAAGIGFLLSKALR